ncbi:MAG: hypothetical protein WD648_11735 [Planctomycetaceae bacterium]
MRENQDAVRPVFRMLWLFVAIFFIPAALYGIWLLIHGEWLTGCEFFAVLGFWSYLAYRLSRPERTADDGSN